MYCSAWGDGYIGLLHVAYTDLSLRNPHIAKKKNKARFDPQQQQLPCPLALGKRACISRTRHTMVVYKYAPVAQVSLVFVVCVCVWCDRGSIGCVVLFTCTPLSMFVFAREHSTAQHSGAMFFLTQSSPPEREHTADRLC